MGIFMLIRKVINEIIPTIASKPVIPHDTLFTPLTSPNMIMVE
jgi:hypothetical protein